MRAWEVIHFDVDRPTLWGPLQNHEVEERLKAGVFNWVDFARGIGFGADWKRFCEIEEFRPLMPEFPELRDLYAQAAAAQNRGRGKRSSSVSASERSLSATNSQYLELTTGLIAKKSNEWHLQYNGSEFGPFKVAEVERILESGRLTGGDIYLWSKELANWVPVSAIPRFAQKVVDVAALVKKRRLSGELQIQRHSHREMRGPTRVPLVATVSIGQQGVILGVCEDISQSGIQVCIDMDVRLEGQGDQRLWILPLGATGLEGFWVSAELSWVNTRARRAGFRFKQLDARAQALLDRYLSEAKRRLARASA
jgi:hypothetical protein